MGRELARRIGWAQILSFELQGLALTPEDLLGEGSPSALWLSLRSGEEKELLDAADRNGTAGQRICEPTYIKTGRCLFDETSIEPLRCAAGLLDGLVLLGNRDRAFSDEHCHALHQLSEIDSLRLHGGFQIAYSPRLMILQDIED